MTAMVRVLPLWHKEDKSGWGYTVTVSTVSKAGCWSSGLSPFLIGPCKLYRNYISRNMENGWQYAKVYKHHTKPSGAVHRSYWKWAKEGWNNLKAIRYPMGKGEKPEYSLWNGEHLSYVEARKAIYIPLYRDAVKKTDAFHRLQGIYEEADTLVLLDYDAYDHRKLNYNWHQVMHDETRKMGHAFVLAMMLEGYI